VKARAVALASRGFSGHDVSGPMGKVPADSSAPLRPAPPGVGTAFSLFGIPVRVTSSFWFIAVAFGLFGAGGSANAAKGLAYAVVWAGIVFISIMLHELGHALTARAFGAKPTITLHGLGGLTLYEGGRMSRAATWLVSFAGPAVGLILGLLLLAATHRQTLGDEARHVVDSFLWVNIGWSIINLLPVVPFDGGHMMAAFLGPRHALMTALISGFVGFAAAAAGLVFLRSPWIAVLFGSATIGAVRQVQQIWRLGADSKAGLDGELEKARAAVSRGDPTGALATAETIVAQARTARTRNGAILALAWAQASLGRPVAARELIERLDGSAPIDVYLLAAVEDALGSPERASARLEAARQEGLKDVDAIKLLIDLYARDGQLSRAVDVAAQELEVLGREAASAVLAEAVTREAHVAAANLAARMFEVYGDPADAFAEARLQALGGNRVRALELLERLTRQDPVKAAAIGSDPAFASLRGDDRFEELLRAGTTGR
jgi:Zn-dependent protease